ncbi:MAG: glycosyltransferase family 4 protein [Anaerolineae bacterium]|nr:glycosyltransferase family 4 protein [Anaerolineae bacterium]
MARILVAYKQFPAPSVGHAGGESLFALMQALHRRGHRLALVARIAADERQYLSLTAAICDAVYTVPHHRTMRGPRPLAIVRSYLALRAALRHAIRAERPDFLHVETLQTAAITLGLRRPPATYRTQDVNWYMVEQRLPRLHHVRRWLARGERWLLRRLEPWVARRYDLTLAISEGDRRLLAEAIGDARLLLVPLAPAVTHSLGMSPAAAGDANVLFVGAMSRDHNHQGIMWFLDHIWARVLTARPDARLYVVGRGPSEALLRRVDGRSVVVTGSVEDLAPWYEAATVFISPLLVAGGMLQKVLDAMAMGVPIVATSVCNHGVGATPGEHLLIADAPEHFADAVVSLLADAGERARMSAAAQEFVARHYNLDTAVARWDTVIRDLTS